VIADFGTNYTAIGWLTLVLPIGFVALVVGLWVRWFKRSERRDSTEPPRDAGP
jgi:cytochrome c-type biogenesis protein CcmH/NrfF